MRKILPWGNRILVRRRPVGEKLGSGLLVATDETKERPTDLADVVYIPEHSFADKALIDSAQDIVLSLIMKAKTGDANALNALIEFNHFLRVKDIKVGDIVFISKYVGTDFFTSDDSRPVTVVACDDIMGKVWQK